MHTKVSDLTAIQTTRQAGANVNIKIGSNPSFASAGVLYEIDGVPITGSAVDPGTDNRYRNGEVDRSSLNFINPNDIASIEVLKDVSVTAIYGANACTGVVLITTKQGKRGNPNISYSVSYAFQRSARLYHFLITKERMTEENKFLKEMWLEANSIAPYGSSDPSTVQRPFMPIYTDAQITNTPQYESAMKTISRHGFIEQYNISLSGGNS